MRVKRGCVVAAMFALGCGGRVGASDDESGAVTPDIPDEAAEAPSASKMQDTGREPTPVDDPAVVDDPAPLPRPDPRQPMPMAVCGDGRIDFDEECDGALPTRETCATATMGAQPGGTLSCSNNCTFDFSGCFAASSPDPFICIARGGGAQIDPVPVPPFQYCGAYAGGPSLGYCVTGVEQWTGFIQIPQDTCPDGYVCMPQSKIDVPGSCFAICDGGFGDSTCVPTYLVESSPAGQGTSGVLGQSTCQDGETCTPCVNPLDGTETGACHE